MPPDTTCSPTSKDTTIVSGSIPPSGISPPNRQSAKPLNPVSTKSQEGHGYRPSASDRLGWPSDGAPWSSDTGREPVRHRHARRPSLRPRSVFFPGRRSSRLNMIPNGDRGKGFGLRASLELDKHPEGQRSEVVAKCPSGKKLNRMNRM